MSRIALSISLLVTLATTTTACVDSEEDLASEDQAVLPCPKVWGCGENSPVMGPWNFHELDSAGTPNLEHIRLAGLVQNNTWYSVRVIGAQLTATDSSNNTISGSQLDGSYLVVVAEDGLYKIFIKKVTPRAQSTSTFWVGPSTQIETYELTYNHGNGDPRPLCDNPPGRITGEGDNRYWMKPLEAVIYTGDRYDSAAKSVTASTYATSGTWFNIGCAGSALAKLVFTRHATVGQIRGYVSSADQRQAMLKMYTSDVCGTGTAYTVKGTPLHWQNIYGWSVFDGTEFAHEAYWDENGAKCMDTHRLFGQYWVEMHNECAAVGHALPACAGVAPGYLTSAVPFPP